MGEKKGRPSDPYAWMVTFSDLIMLLLTFFVMTLTMKSLDKKDTKEMFDTYIKTDKHVGQGMVDEKNDLDIADIGSLKRVLHISTSAMLKKALDKEYINFRANFGVKDDERGVVVTLDAENIFDPGLAVLRPDAYKTLDLAATLLKETDNDILILGHTDNGPIKNGTYPSNWELSSYRALAVFAYLADLAGIPPQRMAAGGYGETRPLYPNTSNENQKKNRRVEMVLRR